MNFEIKGRFSGAVLFALEAVSLKFCVEAAVKSRADLYGANLGGANLRGANLGGANLRGAKLSKGDAELLLVGSRSALQIGPIGSRGDYLFAFLTDHGVYVRTGCFWDTLTKFAAAVKKTHGSNEHATEYKAAITLIQAHAKAWSKS